MKLEAEFFLCLERCFATFKIAAFRHKPLEDFLFLLLTSREHGSQLRKFCSTRAFSNPSQQLILSPVSAACHLLKLKWPCIWQHWSCRSTWRSHGPKFVGVFFWTKKKIFLLFYVHVLKPPWHVKPLRYNNPTHGWPAEDTNFNNYVEKGLTTMSWKQTNHMEKWMHM